MGTPPTDPDNGYGRCAGTLADGSRCGVVLKFRWYQDVPGQGDLCLECWERWFEKQPPPIGPSKAPSKG